MIEENHEKTSVRLVGNGIRTRDLPNASLVRYHGVISLGDGFIVLFNNLSFQIQETDLTYFQFSQLLATLYPYLLLLLIIIIIIIIYINWYWNS